MGALLSLLEREGCRRGLLGVGEGLTAGRCFSLVRDMPYRRASSRAAEAIVREWRGDLFGEALSAGGCFSRVGAGFAGYNGYASVYGRQYGGIFRRGCGRCWRPGRFLMCILFCGCILNGAGRWWMLLGPVAPGFWGWR